MGKRLTVTLLFVIASALVIGFLFLGGPDQFLSEPKHNRIGNIELTAHESTAQQMKDETFLLVLVVSAPKNKAKRDTIRKTWKNSYVEKGKQFFVKFVLGTLQLDGEEKRSLLAESEEHKDVVFLEDHLDNFSNLTRKVLRMFVWADLNVRFSYLLKIDDDAFARLDTIESELKQRNSTKPLYWGYISTDNWPKKTGKWKEEKWTISEKYLPYAFGGGYVLSAGLVHRVAVNADGFVLYNNEDVSVGAWVSPFELERKHDLRFAVSASVNNTCKNSYLIVVVHKQAKENLEKMHHSMSLKRELCSTG